MPQTKFFYVRGRPGLLGWVAILALLALTVSVAIAIAVVAIGVFLFLLPAIVVLAIVYAFIWRARLRQAARSAPRTPMVIEGEFRTVDPSEYDSTPGRDETRRI